MWITAKFNSECKQCTREIATDDRVSWEPGEKGAYCEECGEKIEGGSAPSLAEIRVPVVSGNVSLTRPSPTERATWKQMLNDSEQDGHYKPPKKMWAEMQKLYPRLVDFDGFAL